MTVMFPRFFGVPQWLFRAGLWPQMKPTEHDLYICLLHESERCTTRELRRTDAQLSDLSGVSSRAFCNARKKLQERGLILYRRGGGNVYIYTICDPETGRAWPGDPKIPVLYKKKGDAMNQRNAPQKVVAAAGPKEIKKPTVSFSPSRSSVPSPSPTKPSGRLEDYGLPLSFKNNYPR